MKYVSTVTGHTYDAETVDRLADMILIFYAAGGTVLGALIGCVLSISLRIPQPTPMRFLFVVLTCVFLGALLGCAAVMAILNVRGLMRWDNFVVKRTATLKGASPAKHG